MAYLLHLLLTDRHYVGFATLALLLDLYPIAPCCLKLYRSWGWNGGWGGWCQDGWAAERRTWRMLKGEGRIREEEEDGGGLRSGRT